MKAYLLGAAAAAVALAVVPALAQVAPAPAPAPQVHRAPMAAKVQTRAEVQAKVAEHFARLDTNRDGFVTRAEADAVREQRREKLVERRQERRGQMFDRLDTNRDGALSRSEFEAGGGRREQRIARREGRPGAMHAMRAMRMGPLHGRMFETADANRDGRVSLQEATDAALRHFDSADLNRDGQITREERIQVRQRLRAERRPG